MSPRKFLKLAGDVMAISVAVIIASPFVVAFSLAWWWFFKEMIRSVFQ